MPTYSFVLFVILQDSIFTLKKKKIANNTFFSNWYRRAKITGKLIIKRPFSCCHDLQVTSKERWYCQRVSAVIAKVNGTDYYITAYNNYTSPPSTPPLFTTITNITIIPTLPPALGITDTLKLTDQTRLQYAFQDFSLQYLSVIIVLQVVYTMEETHGHRNLNIHFQGLGISP